MRKVIKILLKLISTTILLLIIIPVLLSVLLTIPSIQSRLIERATTIASQYLGTEVDIRRIDFNAFGNIRIHDFYVEDYQRDTLLFVKEVDFQIQRLALNSREIKFGYVEVKEGAFFLRQGQDSVMNIKHIVDRLTPQTPAKKAVEILFDKLKTSNIELHIDLLNNRNPEYGVDYGNIHFQNITTEVVDFKVNGAAIHAFIKSLSLSESSGFKLTNFSSELYVNSGIINLENCAIDSYYSHISAPYISIIGGSWSEYRDFIERVDVDVKLQNTTISSDDIAYFAPTMRDWGVTLSRLETEVSGEVNNLYVNLINSNFEDSSSLSVQLNITELPNFRQSNINAKVSKGRSNSTDIKRLYSVFTKHEAEESLQRYLDELEEVEFIGEFKGKLTDFATSVAINSALGGVQSNITLKSIDGDYIVDGELTSDALSIGKLLNTNDLGRVWMTTKLNANLSNPRQLACANGEIDRVELRGEMLRNILYDGNLVNSIFKGEVTSRNRGLNFDAKGKLNIQQEQTAFDIDVLLNDIDLKKWKINKVDSIAQLSAHVTMVGEGNDINSIAGEAKISDVIYSYNESQFISENVTIVMGNESSVKTFELQSPYADISYRSPNRYQDSWSYLLGSLSNYMPTLFPYATESLPSESKTPTRRRVSTADYSMLSVDVKDLDPISKIFTSGELHIANDSRLDLSYNPTTRDISLSARSQYVEFNSVLAIYLNFDVTNTLDSLALYGSFKELLVGTRQFKDISILGGASNDQIELRGGYDDTETNASTLIKAIAKLSNDPVRGRMASVQLLPSQITQGEQQWDVKAKNIEIDKHGVAFDDFVIQNEEQELLIKGLASRSTRDTVRVDMQNFDLSILSSVTEALGYNVEGVTNGDIVASSALYNMRVDANILLDSVSVNSLPAPPMRIRAAWDAQQNQARVSLTNRIKGDTLVRGYFIPSKAQYFTQMEIDSLHLGLLDAPLKGVISSTSGYANAHITINGERRNATLEGYVDIHDVESRVDYTNVTYRLPSARIDIKDNELICRNAIIADTLGNQGVMTMSVNLSHLSNISYRVRLNVERFLALNTTLHDNDLFYGTMYATGVVDIAGNKAGVNMDVTATTEDNSEFYMPLSSKSNISTAEFISFVTPKVIVDSTDIVSIKRRFFDNDKRKREARQSNLNVTMSLNVTPVADFQLVIDPTVGDVIRGRGEGRLNLRINPRSNIFDMYGDYTITEGNYLFTLRNIVNKRFIINPGSTIQWTGDPLDAQLDIEAVYKLKTSLQPLISDESSRAIPVDCTILLQDRLLQPEVSFAISLPTADPEQQATVANLLNDQETISRQFFYLMLANSFISDSASGTTSDLGVSTTAATGFELLTNQLSNWLSSSNYNVVIRYRPESELAGDELDFGISRSLINNRLLVEVEGNYTNNDVSGESEESTSTSNFAGEAYITWLIDRSGALRLRGFTQTIDRFDENQGLQETGVGIYYKESFNNFKDLREKVRLRFTRKNVGIKKIDD